MKLYLKLSSAFLVLLFCSCSNSPFKHLTPTNNNTTSVLRFKPQYEKELYRCLVNGSVLFKKYHLSGLLLFKKEQTGMVRAVFQNEIGITFFDFEWGENGVFKVNSIIDRLDKPFIINVLKKDLSMLLFLNVDKKTEKFYVNDRGEEEYSCFNIDNGTNCYISSNDKLLRIENIGKNIVTTINIGEKMELNSMPESVFFDHHKAKFTIKLTKIKIKRNAHVNE